MPVRYTIREQLERIGDPALTTWPFSARYHYGPNGTVDTAEVYNAGSPAAKRYRYAFPTYDALNRLKSADFSSWSGSAWTSTLAYDLAGINYDAAGNITALQRYRETATLIDNLTYGYPGTSNRLSSVTDGVAATAEAWDAETGSFTYDPNGNVATAPAPYSITATTYDHRNLPVSLTRTGTTTTYRYDDAGQRITKQVGAGNTEVYVLDGPVALGVVTVNSSGTATSWFFNVVALNRVVGRQPNTGSRSYYHTDLLGSTRAVVQGATVVESYDFEPWGLLMPGRTLGSGTKEGFTRKEQDAETGLDYFGARYYMPALGRWASVDPIADSFPPWSAYTYVKNNPVAYTDPFGLKECPNPPCFRVEGSQGFQNQWARLVSHSSTLAGLVVEATRSDKPPFVLLETKESTLGTHGSAGGYTLTLDKTGRDVDPSKVPVVNIISKVSITDLQDPTARGIMIAGNKVATLENVMVHEFAHGVLAGQQYQSNEAQAKKVECKVMAQVPGGRC